MVGLRDKFVGAGNIGPGKGQLKKARARAPGRRAVHRVYSWKVLFCILNSSLLLSSLQTDTDL